MSTRRRIRALFDDSREGPGRVVAWIILALIVVSSVAVMVETVPGLSAPVQTWLRRIELLAVGAFTVEYVLRVGSAERPLRKALEPLVVIDLLAILPFYVGLFADDVIDLRLLRLLRTLRVLRLLKLQRYTTALTMLVSVLRDARHKLFAFLLIAALCIVLMGSLMYQVEPETFRSIPHAIWWSVVTLTTVGYGETTPQTPEARAVAGLLMLLGIGVIAIPTGILSSGMVAYYRRREREVTCEACGLEEHHADARFCRRCGARLPVEGPVAAAEP